MQTYIQSGNVVFDHDADEATRCVADLEAPAAGDIRVRDPGAPAHAPRDLAAVVAGNPFPAAEPTRPLVSFLRDDPPPGALDGVDVAAFAPEAFVLAGREIYLDLPAGAGRAGLPQALARAHGTPRDRPATGARC